MLRKVTLILLAVISILGCGIQTANSGGTQSAGGGSQEFSADASLPDLVVTQISIPSGDKLFVKYRNIGQSTNGGQFRIVVTVHEKTHLSGYLPVPDPGEFAFLEVPLSALGVVYADVFEVKAQVDPDNLVQEVSQLNNSFLYDHLSPLLGDAVVINASIECTVGAGVILNYRIQNIGYLFPNSPTSYTKITISNGATHSTAYFNSPIHQGAGIGGTSLALNPFNGVNFPFASTCEANNFSVTIEANSDHAEIEGNYSNNTTTISYP